MQISKPFRPAACALALAGLAPSAQALDIVLTQGPSSALSSQQLAAFEAAASYWESKLSDKVTVYIQVGFGNLGANELAQASSTKLALDYADLRSLLVSDARSATDASAVGQLQPGAALSFLATQGDLSARLDNDGSTNNSRLFLTTANAKALGTDAGTSLSQPDAVITFANAFAGSFAYERNQLAGDKMDFITVAQHEIGHALGFISGVDGIDNCAGAANPCGLEAAANRFETLPWFYALDLYRYSAPGTLDLRVGGSPYFSVDGGATAIEAFSTGEAFGNGWQASHFGTNVLTLMKPTVSFGQAYDATASDLMALDAIGWDLAAPVPEPASYALLLGGLGVVAWARRRRGGNVVSA